MSSITPYEDHTDERYARGSKGVKRRPEQSPGGRHPNSMGNRILTSKPESKELAKELGYKDAAEMKKAYHAWKKERDIDDIAMNNWAKEGFVTRGGMDEKIWNVEAVLEGEKDEDE